jgi:cation-transporting P-type ATPase 13A2
MITGDNPLTAISVAQECNLISQTAHVFTPSFIQGECSGISISSVLTSSLLTFLWAGNAMTPLSKLSWSSMDDPAWKLDDYSLKPLTPPPHHSVDADMVDYQDYVIVITGDVFRWMINNAPLETLQRVCALNTAFVRRR